MNAIFTIAANNYLTLANELAATAKVHHPDLNVFIVVADKKSDLIDYEDEIVGEIVFIENLISDSVTLNNLSDKYTITEFCTTIKPDCFEYFFNKGYDRVVYLDPDIQVFSSFEEIFDGDFDSSIALTPHVCSPTPIENNPSDHDLMKTGVYNLGFLYMKRNIETIGFVKWWKEILYKNGQCDLANGYFYDQLWMMLAPAFVDKVFILRHLGYNMCNWNLHERSLTRVGNKYYVNQNIPLRFFHFSQINRKNLPYLASYNTTYTTDNRPDVKDIYLNYLDLVDNIKFSKKEIVPFFGKSVLVKVAEPAKVSKIYHIKCILHHLKHLFY